MSRFLVLGYLCCFSILFSNCNLPKKGDLKGVSSSKWFQERPYGMSLIPQGAFQMGRVSGEIFDKGDTTSKRVTISSFYMDETEITNQEYRDFVFWVRDSIVRTHLGDAAEELSLTKKDKNTVGKYAYKYLDTTNMTVYQKYMYEYYPESIAKRIDWKEPLEWDDRKYVDENYKKAMDDIYLPFEDGISNAKIMNIEKLKFTYTEIDFNKKMLSKSKKNIRKETIEVYPDTLVWIKDFTYVYTEPRHNEYFYEKAYTQYPVVGVNWHQAKAFCIWRTLLRSKIQKPRGHHLLPRFRLPTEIEWEYAASGGIEAKYPWSGASTMNKKGCYQANFKPLRGDYSVDGSVYTSRAGMYNSNLFNLYDMSGNVSEWTISTYSSNSYLFENDMNPNYANQENKRKVIRGGSWRDVYHYLQTTTRDYEYADSSRSYVGFRTVQDYLGNPLME